MIRQQFDVDGYWEVIVYYNINSDLFFPVSKELERIGLTSKTINEIYNALTSKAKAVTCSNSAYYTSIVLFRKHSSNADYINSIVHEAEHIKQAMLNKYQVGDFGEPPAYTIGYLVMRMYDVFKRFIKT